MGCFADDTALWSVPSNENHLRSKLLQREINRFTDWTKYWKMSINPSKCSFITIHKSNSPIPNNHYTIDGKSLTRVSKNILVFGWTLTSPSTTISMNYTINYNNTSIICFLKKILSVIIPKTILQIYIKLDHIEYGSYYFHNYK